MIEVTDSLTFSENGTENRKTLTIARRIRANATGQASAHLGDRDFRRILGEICS